MPAIVPIGYVRSVLKDRSHAPKQGWEGAPDVIIDIDPAWVEGLDGLHAGQEIWILTWLDRADRSVLKVHPRGDLDNPLTGVFATRSPDRPNPIGMHRATVLSVTDAALEVAAVEAIDGTPVLDLKPVIERAAEF